ncbi:MAG TPA: VOC family protein [Bacteroidales bacterium]|nr:VOC family protein [Bacteroidales bacterium]
MKKIFINLPSKDLKKTATFFARMGFSFDPQFSDDNAKCLIISDEIYVMFLSEQFFRSFTNKDIPDTSKTTGAILSLTAESREEVDSFMEHCIAAGGRDVSKPQEMDFIYTRSFEDPDGHLWEVFYMDMAKIRIEPDLQPK